MKKVFSFLAVLALVSMVSSSVFAAFTGVSKTAKAIFAEQELIFDVELYDWVSGKDYTFGTGGAYTQQADYINFDTNIELGVEDVQKSSGTTFARIHSNLVEQSAGTTIIMFSSNTKTDSVYKANAANDNKYRGLIRKGNTSSYVLGDHAPLYMMSVKVSSATENFKTTLPTFSSYETYSAVRTIYDIADNDWSTIDRDAFKVIGVSGSKGGIWLGGEFNNQGAFATKWFSGKEDAILFFQAEFSNISAGDEFGTDTLFFQIATE